MTTISAAGIAEIIEYAGYLWWLWLFILGYFYYNWVREHLAFSPLLVIVIGAILVYYLVIQYPLLGSIGLVGYTLIFSGVLYLLPMFLPFLKKR
ncbi:MAG: hypothetical protein V1708_03210 [Candidatus Micrarchaeota archaeon]